MFDLGRGSLAELKGVHPDLVLVTKRSIQLTPVDFSVHDGLRTDEEQEEYIRTGVSHLRKSKHLKQPDGWGHAVDLVPYINRRLRWEIGACCKIAEAVRQAAREHNVKIIWGGAWARIDTSNIDPEVMVEEYVAKRRRQGRKPFVDGPHFELA